jgi:hypothetical protein
MIQDITSWNWGVRSADPNVAEIATNAPELDTCSMKRLVTRW